MRSWLKPKLCFNSADIRQEQDHIFFIIIIILDDDLGFVTRLREFWSSFNISKRESIFYGKNRHCLEILLLRSRVFWAENLLIWPYLTGLSSLRCCSLGNNHLARLIYWESQYFSISYTGFWCLRIILRVLKFFTLQSFQVKGENLYFIGWIAVVVPLRFFFWIPSSTTFVFKIKIRLKSLLRFFFV